MTLSTRITQAFIGTILSCTEGRELVIHRDALLAVDEDGIIQHFESSTTEDSRLVLQQLKEEEPRGQLIELGEHGWLLPGFVDTHLHAPQYLNAGTALDKPLMEWLNHYTFAAEARIDADPHGLGTKVYAKLLQRMVESGTTLASVFGTLTVEANVVLASAFVKAGIRGHIGKVNMDLNSPSWYTETTSQSLSRTREFIAALSALQDPLGLVQPVLTPRFVPTCSRELLKGLREIAQEYDEGEGMRVQSHLCESEGEVELSQSMWGGKTDVEVMHEHHLLTPSTLMAHCTHSTPSTLSLLSTTGTSISHCPLSNLYFSPERSLPLREALTAGVKVGLGSDVSGGYQVGVGEGMKWAVAVSRAREGARASRAQGEQEESLAISWKESLFLATLGGAQAMGMGHLVGSFERGKQLDAQWILLGQKGSRVDWFEPAEAEGKEVDLVEELVEKWWCNGREEDRVGVWVRGRRVREA